MVDPRTLIKTALRPIYFRPAPDLTAGAGVSLRSLRLEDINRLFELIEENRPHLREWLSWIELIQDIHDCRKFIFSVNYKNIYSGKWVYGIWYGDKLVGLLDFNEPNSSKKEISIGYWLAQKYQGRGIVSRSVKSCCSYLFKERGVKKIVIKCASDNARSRAVAIRLGFNWEGITLDAGQVNGRQVDLDQYGLTLRDWNDLHEAS
ncbi:MAG: GNAT family protein [Bacteroidota bacterium]